MEISIHPIEMLKAVRYKRKKKKADTYPYSGIECLMRRTREGQNNYSRMDD